ncbi:MAG: mannose-6-phosphate isomerase, class I, partial [Treponema sp.]|nr:mannose-6-phosphate isomerase, class I [Treponema sp.]
MTKSDLRIDILGTNFTISADEDPDYLETLLEKYRKTVDNVQQVSGLKDPLKIAVLTGFLLCDDLEKAGIETAPGKKDDSGEAEQLTLGMISRLDEVIFHSSETPDTVIKDTVSEPDSAFPEIYKLQNSVKNYDWGSPVWIPALLGQKNVSRIPWAELWMGVHPSAPSRVITGETGNTEEGPATSGVYPLLSDLIGENKESFLGTETARLYGKLPYLFKVLAAAKPLSIQAHPSKEQAVEGFERENREGIPLGAETRNYKDDGDKPEIICAIGPYVALCGFRKPEEIDALLRIISRDSEGELKAGFESLISALEQKNENPYTAFLKALFGLDRGTLASLGPFLKKCQVQLERDFPEYLDEWDLCSYLARLYPGDTGIISPLYLNILELSIGEAMFIPSGVLHAYIHGMGIELMADSDNVL